MDSITIVIIDDDEDDGFFLREALLQINSLANITRFDDVLDGYNALKTLPPDFLFLDMNLPKVSGFEALNLFRQDHRFDSTEIILYSSNMPDDLIRQSIKLGAGYAFQKPYTVKEFVGILKPIIQSR